MGWKRIRQHYRVDEAHAIVKIKEGRVHFGSGYMGSILVVDPDGRIHERRDALSGSIAKCAAMIGEDPATFRAMFEQRDEFDRSITVFTWDEDRILEKRCEAIGWPNVTHDGDLMADNRYSTDRQTVIDWAKEDAASAVAAYRRHLVEIEQKMAEAMRNLAHADQVLNRLRGDHPDHDAGARSQ